MTKIVNNPISTVDCYIILINLMVYYGKEVSLIKYFIENVSGSTISILVNNEPNFHFMF